MHCFAFTAKWSAQKLGCVNFVQKSTIEEKTKKKEMRNRIHIISKLDWLANGQTLKNEKAIYRKKIFK
jgi:hypothetical protein